MRQHISTESAGLKVMQKRRATLSLEVVVIAALCILVLIVLTILFSSRMGAWNSGLKHCDTVCMETSQACIDAGYQIPVMQNSCEDNSGGKFTKEAYCCREKK